MAEVHRPGPGARVAPTQHLMARTAVEEEVEVEVARRVRQAPTVERLQDMVEEEAAVAMV